MLLRVFGVRRVVCVGVCRLGGESHAGGSGSDTTSSSSRSDGSRSIGLGDDLGGDRHLRFQYIPSRSCLPALPALPRRLGFLGPFRRGLFGVGLFTLTQRAHRLLDDPSHPGDFDPLAIPTRFKEPSGRALSHHFRNDRCGNLSLRSRGRLGRVFAVAGFGPARGGVRLVSVANGHILGNAFVIIGNLVVSLGSFTDLPVVTVVTVVVPVSVDGNEFPPERVSVVVDRDRASTKHDVVWVWSIDQIFLGNIPRWCDDAVFPGVGAPVFRSFASPSVNLFRRPLRSVS